MKPEEYGRMYEAEEGHWWYAGMRSISFALLGEPLPRGADVLDAGCGTGGFLAAIGPVGHAFGVDLSPEAAHRCRLRGVTLARARVAALPFPEASFDLVTCFDVVYHLWVEDDRAAVREMARVLRPGGRLLLRAPALAWLRGAHDEAVLTRHRYTRREVAELFCDAGLELQRVTYANTLLLPLLLLRRSLDRMTGREGSDVGPLPRPVDRLFRGLLEVEARLARHVSLPAGASVFGLARKPLEPGSLDPIRTGEGTR